MHKGQTSSEKEQPRHDDHENSKRCHNDKEHAHSDGEARPPDPGQATTLLLRTREGHLGGLTAAAARRRLDRDSDIALQMLLQRSIAPRAKTQ